MIPDSARTRGLPDREPVPENHLERDRVADDPLSDASLLAGVRNRDAAALERFFDAAFPHVHGLAIRLTGGRREAAEDVTQEVFLKVYRVADRLDPARPARPWLTTIACNAARDATRRAKTRPERPVDSTFVAEASASTPAPSAREESSEDALRVQAALDRLTETERCIVVLHDYEGLPHSEIARTLALSHAAVRKRYSRALDRMRQHLEGDLP